MMDVFVTRTESGWLFSDAEIHESEVGNSWPIAQANVVLFLCRTTATWTDTKSISDEDCLEFRKRVTQVIPDEFWISGRFQLSGFDYLELTYG